MPTRLPYCTLDVFTHSRHAGNPLAVVLLADGLDEATQHAIAREFNLSETVFVQRPRSADSVASLRIWTPAGELPFAGHPTVGTAWALGQRGAGSELVLDEVIGAVRCWSDALGAGFALPKLPKRVEHDMQPDWAELLGTPPASVGDVRLVSAGVPFWLVELDGVEALAALQPRPEAIAAQLPADIRQIYAYVRGDWRTRMFAPALGIGEDPATGAAAAALSLVVAEGLDDGRHQVVLLQGVEMGRPSRLELSLTVAGGVLVDAGLAGGVVAVAEGWLTLD